MIGAIPIIAENRIREAQQRGELDHLAGAGKPFTDLAGSDDPDWWLKKKLARERLGPGEIEVIMEGFRKHR